MPYGLRIPPSGSWMSPIRGCAQSRSLRCGVTRLGRSGVKEEDMSNMGIGDAHAAAPPQWVRHSERVFSVPGLLSGDECAALIELAEQRGFDAASVRTAAGQQLMRHMRNNERALKAGRRTSGNSRWCLSRDTGCFSFMTRGMKGPRSRRDSSTCCGRMSCVPCGAPLNGNSRTISLDPRYPATS